MQRATPDEVGLTTVGLDATDRAVQKQIDAGVVAGAVTLVARHGKVARVHAMGLKDIASGEPMVEDTIFRIFSMTKPITGTAMMILYDQGLWRPEDAIAKHLPELAELKVFAGEDDGRTLFVEAARAPTMADLMTHQAGFAYGINIGEPSDRVEAMYREAGVQQSSDLKDMVARLAKLPLAYQPGSRWRYSLSMDVQGAIIERLSGRSLPDFLRTFIFEPLGMIDTAFFVGPEKRHRLATLYFKAADTPLAPLSVNPLRPDPESEPSFAMGGGGLFSTANDYARYAQMLLNGGELDGVRIVSADAVREQMTNRLPDAMLETRFVAGHHKFRPGFGYGYNGVVVTDPALADLPVGAGTYFWDGAAGTWFWVDPINQLLFVGMIQILSYSAPPLQTTTQISISEALIK
jgi:CubicO group peptidase (beta-lactamase class C family)